MKHYILDISLAQPEHEYWGKLTDEEYIEGLKSHLRNFPHNVKLVEIIDDTNFEMTNEGYNEAKTYLDSIGKLKEFENNELSIDGFSLVYYANSIKEKRSE